MRALLVILAAIVLLVAAFVALAPASLVVPVIATATSEHVRLGDVDGTIWSGTGTLVGDDGRRVPFGWKTDRVSLAQGKLRMQLAPVDDGAKPRGDITLDGDTFRARDVAFSLPAAWLADAFAAKMPVSLAGDIDVTIGSLDWAARGSRGDVRIDWRNAQLGARGAPPLDVGDVTAMLTANGDRLAGPVANDGGAVAIAGDVALVTNGNGEANLLLTPRRDDDALLRLLAVVGTPEGSGYRVRSQWRAR